MAVSDWSGASLPWVEELAAVKERIGALFGRAEPRRQVGLLLEGPGHLPGFCDRAAWRSKRRPDLGRDGVCEEGQPFGRGCASIQRHGRTGRDLSDRGFSQLCGS